MNTHKNLCVCVCACLCETNTLNPSHPQGYVTWYMKNPTQLLKITSPPATQTFTLLAQENKKGNVYKMVTICFLS